MPAKYGQNFLTDKNIARKIADAAQITADDTVVEIGPGKGIITKILCEQARKVIAIEIDTLLAERLKNNLIADNLEVKNADILEARIPEPQSGGKKYVLVGNLPYYISTAIVRKIIPQDFWKRAIFTFQKEVAERIAAKPTKVSPKRYGYISVITSYYADAKILFAIPPEAFSPRPKVTSAVVGFTPKTEGKFEDAETEKLFVKIVESAFAHRRKTVLNSFAEVTGIEKRTLEKILLAAKINPASRSEQLTLDDYKNLTYIYKKSII